MASNNMLDVDFSEEYNDIIVGVNLDESKLKVYHKDSKEIYEKNVLIWNTEIDDYWFRIFDSNNIIFISDYYGITVYDNKLNIMYQKKIPDEIKFNVVFGYNRKELKNSIKNNDCERLCLKYWFSSDARVIRGYCIYENPECVEPKNILKFYF